MIYNSEMMCVPQSLLWINLMTYRFSEYNRIYIHIQIIYSFIMMKHHHDGTEIINIINVLFSVTRFIFCERI